MKNYMNFNAFRNDMSVAMEELAKKYNITLTPGGITYDNNTFTIKVEGKRNDIDVVKAQYMESLNYMKYYGFTEDDYQKEFVSNGKRYSIIGFKPGNKYNVVVKRYDGKQFAMVGSGVLKALGR